MRYERGTGPPISFALLSLFSSSWSIAFLRRGQMLLKQPLPSACCRFYKKQKKGFFCVHEFEESFKLCLLLLTILLWMRLALHRGLKRWRLCCFSGNKLVFFLMFHLERFIGNIRWVIDKLTFCMTQECWKFCSRIKHEKICILFSFRDYSWINTTQKK